MIRLFNVYYPTRTLVLLLCEALLVSGSFLLAATYLFEDSYIVLFYENGLLKIIGITALTLLLSYYSISTNRSACPADGRSISASFSS